jgi:DNA/RNA-binding domain of Phe-tRNA-synthetase-like protein
MLTFSISQDLFSRFPDVTVHALRVERMREALASVDSVAILNRAIENCVVDPEKVPEDPAVAGWREAYGMMGVKPSKFRSSIEALLRRASKKQPLDLPIPSVNLYNACSIAGKAPMGGYDRALIPGAEMSLRFARPSGDTFNPLGSEASAFPLTDGLVVYAAGSDVLCWGFNARDAAQTALTAESDIGIFFAEAALDHQSASAFAALDMLKAEFVQAGAQTGAILTANRSKPSFEI